MSSSILVVGQMCRVGWREKVGREKVMGGEGEGEVNRDGE